MQKIKKTHYYILSAAVICAMAACNGNTATTTTTTDSTRMSPGDSSVTTSTTTTTTHHKYAGSFVPQANVKYYDLRTKKQVSVRIDTEKGEVVNMETNEPMDLFVEPTKHDTIYGQTGSVVNNYILRDDSGYRVDTVRINTVQVQTVAATPDAQTDQTGKYKEKDKENKTKIRTDDEKIKEKNGKTKIKKR
jgi:hypothetical protein